MEITAPHFPGRAPIDAYGDGGFRFADMSHRGSVLLLPSGIYGWAPSTLSEVTRESLERLRADAGAIDVFLVGCGPDIGRIPEPVERFLAEIDIYPEAMSTGAAARTYNVLLAEQRSVAAGLIAVETP